MSSNLLSPVDACGCGDTGYLTTRTLPIDLAHGVGKVHLVPVYHCGSGQCEQYSLPEDVSRRLEDIAEVMEEKLTLEETFTWPDQQKPTPSLDPLRQSDTLESITQAFTLRLSNREYEDGKVYLIVPGQAVVFKSYLDDTEYYVLRHIPGISIENISFSFSKFYADQPVQSLEEITALEEEGQLKELAVLKLDDVEDALNDEFGDIIERN